MPEVKAHFLLPLRDNNGRDLSAEIEAVRDALFIEFGGWTFQGYVQGAFTMSDMSMCVDTSASFFVLLDESRLVLLESILHDFRSKTDQEAIYLEIQRKIDIRFIR